MTNLIVNCIALSLCWLGSVTVYLASQQQAVLSNPISKKAGWLGFAITIGIAFWLLTRFHHGLAAFIVLLALVMSSWIALALLMPYFPKQNKVLVVGTLFTLVTAVIGGLYVV